VYGKGDQVEIPHSTEEQIVDLLKEHEAGLA
jgi:hypothetical protein